MPKNGRPAFIMKIHYLKPQSEASDCIFISSLCDTSTKDGSLQDYYEDSESIFFSL